MLPLLAIGLLTTALGTATTAFAQCISARDGTVTQPLYAGQTIDAGTVSVRVVGPNLEVTYTTTGGWELVQVQLWVGDDVADMPQTRKGNPKVGNFPYQSGVITGETSYTIWVPLGDLDFSCPGNDEDYYVAAHADLRKPDGTGGFQTETGWADGDRMVEKGNWGTYFSVQLTCDCGSGGGAGNECETAFAFGGEDMAVCFLDIDEDGDGNGDFNRWGWTNGPLGPGTYTFAIYAGAGQCDILTGVEVGSLTVDYDGGSATVTYDMNAGFTMDVTHLYVGFEKLASGVNGGYAVAPGQYPYIHNLNDAVSDTYYVVNSLSGDIYVVAHTVACGDFGS